MYQFTTGLEKPSVHSIYEILNSWQWLNYWNVTLENLRLRIWNILCLANLLSFISSLSVEDNHYFYGHYITYMQTHICTCTCTYDYTDTINTIHNSYPRINFMLLFEEIDCFKCWINTIT